MVVFILLISILFTSKVNSGNISNRSNPNIIIRTYPNIIYRDASIVAIIVQLCYIINVALTNTNVYQTPRLTKITIQK